MIVTGMPVRMVVAMIVMRLIMMMGMTVMHMAVTRCAGLRRVVILHRGRLGNCGQVERSRLS